MTWEEIKTNHRDDIKRQAIRFYRSKDTVFAGERPMKRWTLCVQIIVEAWLMLGPQLDNVPGKPICLPSPNYLFKRKDFGLSAYWPRNAEMLAIILTMSQD
jgi:hypothetical protein